MEGVARNQSARDHREDLRKQLKLDSKRKSSHASGKPEDGRSFHSLDVRGRRKRSAKLLS